MLLFYACLCSFCCNRKLHSILNFMITKKNAYLRVCTIIILWSLFQDWENAYVCVRADDIYHRKTIVVHTKYIYDYVNGE